MSAQSHGDAASGGGSPREVMCGPETGSLVTAWYGKVPARGDFVTRGLGPEWVAAWDGAIQQLYLRISQHRSTSDALEPWSRFRPWRFVAWGDDGHVLPLVVGVMVPSSDRVGRSFPLLVVQAAAMELRSTQDWQRLDAGLDRLSDAALDASDTADPRMVEDYANVLTSLPALFACDPVSQARTAPAGVRELATPAMAAWPCMASLWWQVPAAGVEPQRYRDAWPPRMDWFRQEPRP